MDAFRKIQSKIDPANPYIIVIVSLVVLIIIMMIFIPSPKTGPILKISIYFGIALTIILDLFQRKIREKYTDDTYTSTIMKTVESTIGSNEGSFVEALNEI